MIVIVPLALLGIAGLVLGIWALVAAFLTARRPVRPSHWWIRCLITFVSGLLLGWAAWHFQLLLGYPLTLDHQRWWLVGVPFFAAAFDSHGRDFLGSLTLPALVGNSVFWFLVPQITLFFYARAYAKRHARA